MERPAPCQREVGNTQFGNNTTIHQDNNTFNLHIPLQPARSAIRIIPYPLNEDLVNRPDLIEKLNTLLPPTSHTYGSAALWGLGGSGKTQIALSYAYQRCNKENCSVFWVHADSEATFSQDCKTIAHAFGIDQQLKGEDLYAAVRDQIAAQPDWVLILDNADDLRLFGVNQTSEQTRSLFQYIPRGSTGTVLWTSRDARIAGTLVGSKRGIKVARMKSNEAEELLTIARDLETNDENLETATLLEELQWLPLAITQAGTYMRRTSTSVREYLALLAQSKRRWDILKSNEFDRHRRPNVPNNVLEAWSISIDRLRQESEIAYNILHVIAYVANQNISHDIITTILKHSDRSLVQLEKLEAEAAKAVTRLKEFSFLGMQQMEDGGRSYEMHKLVQEATRYGLSAWKSGTLENVPLNREDEQFFSGIAVQVIYDLFPDPKPETWSQCEKYLAHAVQIGDWADLNERQTETSHLFSRVFLFLYDRTRWGEGELVIKKRLELDRKTWGEKHPHTMISMEYLARTYGAQGRYKEAEILGTQLLHLRQEILGDGHPETIQSMANLALTYNSQGRYKEAEALQIQALELGRTILKDNDPDIIQGMGNLALTYNSQGRYKEAEVLEIQVLDLRREILGDRHPDTIQSMANLATAYSAQGRYKEAEALQVQALDLRREILGDKDRRTIRSIGSLGVLYFVQGRYKEAEALTIQVLTLQQEILGNKHPETIWSIANLGSTYYIQGRYKEAEALAVQVLNLRQEVLGNKHPDTIWSITGLGATCYAQGRYKEAAALAAQVLDLEREVLGKEHPSTLKTMHNLALTLKKQGRTSESLALFGECVQYRRSVLGPDHPDTVLSANCLDYLKSYVKSEVRILELKRVGKGAGRDSTRVCKKRHSKTSRLRKTGELDRLQ